MTRPASTVSLSTRLQTGVAYLVLCGIAVVMLIPFIVMISTAFKTQSDVFRFPPRLLPYSEVITLVDGKPQPLYRFQIDGQARLLVATDERISVGFFASERDLSPDNPRDSHNLVSVPMAEAQSLPSQIALKRADGSVVNFDLYQVRVAGTRQTLTLAYRVNQTVFIDPADLAFRHRAVLRDAQPAENIAFQFDNYQSVFDLGLTRALANTVLVTLSVMVGQLVTSILGGYAFARIRFPGRDTIFVIYLGSIMIPFVVILIPLYRLMISIGWQGELSALIVPWIFTAYGTFLMRQAFLSVPRELEEAALMDGASRWRIIWTIFVPLAKPAIATLAVFAFLYAWNSFLWPLLITGQGNPDAHVLTIALEKLSGNYDQRPNIVMAASTLATLPPILIFLLAQRYFVQSYSSSGVHG